MYPSTPKLTIKVTLFEGTYLTESRVAEFTLEDYFQAEELFHDIVDMVEFPKQASPSCDRDESHGCYNDDCYAEEELKPDESHDCCSRGAGESSPSAYEYAKEVNRTYPLPKTHPYRRNKSKE